MGVESNEENINEENIGAMTQVDRIALERWFEMRDAEAFRGIASRYAPMVYATCRRLLKNATDAEDVTQDCFAALAQAKRISDVRSLGAWLHGMATNLSLRRIRSERRRKDREARFAAAHGVRAEASWNDVFEYVDEAVAELPEKFRIPVVAHFLEDRAHAEIAEGLGVSRQTVAYRIGKGIETVRKSLKKRGIAVTASALAAMMRANMAEAAPIPATLTAALGKLAIAGSEVAVAAHGGLGIAGFVLSLKSILAVLALLAVGALVAAGLYMTLSHGGDETLSAAVPAQATERTGELSETVEADADPRQADRALQETRAPETADVGKPGSEGLTSVSGVVKDERGNPIDGAEVVLVFTKRSEEEYLPGYVRWASRAESDREGVYIVDGIPFDRVAVYTIGKRIQEKCGAVLSANKEGYSAARRGVALERGQAQSGVDLELPAGKSVPGRVLDSDGAPIPGAIVETMHVWHSQERAFRPAKDASGAGFCLSDSSGRFALHVGHEAEWCNLRVKSETHGQSFFHRIPLTQGEIELTAGSATLRGSVTRSDGSLAKGYLVSVCNKAWGPRHPNTLRMPLISGNFRIVHSLQSVVDAEGYYEVVGIISGMHYEASVGKPRRKQRRGYSAVECLPVHPPDEAPQPHKFYARPGAAAIWNVALPDMITLYGRVVTQYARRSAGKHAISLRKDDGELILPKGDFSDDQGFFEFQLCTGGGQYQFVALPHYIPDVDSEWVEDMVRRFGKELHLDGNETIELELETFESVEWPIRVVDSQRKPLGSVTATCHMTTADGDTFSYNRGCELDANGTTTLYLNPIPNSDLWIEGRCTLKDVGEARGESRHHTARPGAVLPAETIVLELLCGVKGTLLDRGGHAQRFAKITVQGDYGDGERHELERETENHGEFGCHLRAGFSTLHVRLKETPHVWSFEAAGKPGDTFDLGELVLAAEGGIAGTVTNPSGDPVRDVHVGCWLLLADGTYCGVPGANSDAAGAFRIAEGIPAGVYEHVVLAYKDADTNQLHYVTLDNVEIAADQLTDLGAPSFEPISDEDFPALTGGHK